MLTLTIQPLEKLPVSSEPQSSADRFGVNSQEA